MNWSPEVIQFGYFGHVRCEASWSLDAGFSQRLVDYDLWHVWDGAGKMELNGETIDLHAGVCIWMRPGGKYLAEHDPENPLGVTYIHFSHKTAEFSSKDLPHEVHQVRDPRFFGASAKEIVRLLRLRKADNTQIGPPEWLFSTLLNELLAQESTNNAVSWARYRAKIEGQAARIFEQPGFSPSVSELAREISLSPDHYTRIFRKITGEAPREWIQRARLERASQLLRETGLSVTEIAEECGYADVFQFSRMFKRSMGESPSQWRR